MSDTVAATASHDFSSLTADAVYDAWTDQGLFRKWMERHLGERDEDARVTRVEADAVVGGRFDLADTREGSEAWGYYRVLERPERIAFTWFVSPEEEAEDNSLVTISIVPQGKGCAVTVSHRMDAEWADYVERTADAWKSMLEAIDQTFS
ncbi:MAG: SRPBCC family protein [Brevundimonas sp.]